MEWRKKKENKLLNQVAFRDPGGEKWCWQCELARLPNSYFSDHFSLAARNYTRVAEIVRFALDGKPHFNKRLIEMFKKKKKRFREDV